MMGVQQSDERLFSYGVCLEKRVRADNPLRKIAEAVDFSFVREKVREFYGRNGNVSIDPVVVLKMMFLLFFDDVKSERELMRIIPERLDYLWFLGYGLDDEVPDHSVLSKARARWGKAVFEGLFVRSVLQCVEAGLVGGEKLYADGSLIEANASHDSVVEGPPELIAALRRAYGAQEEKLEEARGENEEGGEDGNDKGSQAPKGGPRPVNARIMSRSDPDARSVRYGPGKAQLCYKHHRAVDDVYGVIGAVETTYGDVDEGSRLEALIEQFEQNTEGQVKTAVGDAGYGTVANFRNLQRKGICTHMSDIAGRLKKGKRNRGIFGEEKFTYDAQEDRYICPAGQYLKNKSFSPSRGYWVYKLSKLTCNACALKSQCTRSRHGRHINRRPDQELIERGRQQAASVEGKRDRRRRKHLVEGSFADASNNHHFKRSRWRRLHNQQIQDYIIAAIQNIRICLARAKNKPKAALQASLQDYSGLFAFVRGDHRPLPTH
jgi:transposase